MEGGSDGRGPCPRVGENFPLSRRVCVSSSSSRVLVQAELPYDEPPAWYLPVANRFGEALARLGHAEEADRLWQKSLSFLAFLDTR